MTRAWTEKVGDKGWSYQTIIEASVAENDKPGHRNSGRVGSGVLKGSPLKLLK